MKMDEKTKKAKSLLQDWLNRHVDTRSTYTYGVIEEVCSLLQPPVRQSSKAGVGEFDVKKIREAVNDTEVIADAPARLRATIEKACAHIDTLEEQLVLVENQCQVNGRDAATWKMKIGSLQMEWAEYKEFLMEKYPVEDGSQWEFTCACHKKIDALLKGDDESPKKPG